MKKRITASAVAFIACCAVSAVSWARTSDDVRSYDIKKFSGIRTEAYTESTWRSWTRWYSADVSIEVIKSGSYDVRVQASDPEFRDAVSIEKQGRTLVVRTRPVKSRKNDRSEIRVIVKTPQLDHIDIGGNYSMTVEGGTFSSGSVDISVSGAASLSGYSADSDYAEVDFSGAASVNDFNLNVAEKCSFSLSGAGEVRGFTIKAGVLDFDASGAGSVRTAEIVADRADMDISGAASMSGAAVTFNNVSIDMSGGSSYSMKGAAGDAEVELSGAARLDMQSDTKCGSLILECTGASVAHFENAPYRNVTVSAYGASKACVKATEVLKTDISRTSSLDYYGNPKSVTHISDNIRSH